MSLSEEEEEGEDFGQRHPPLSVYIKGILERYPDDIPTIVSGEKVAYLDPQEKVWVRRSGRMFTLNNLHSKYPNALTSFCGIADFTTGLLYYPKTLFRFPLRTVPSELSENVYSLKKLEELIDALRREAKVLLPFLRSIDTIEVHRITSDGRCSLLFKVEIESSCKRLLKSKRQDFLKQLKVVHSRQSYGISSPISFITDFRIKVTDHSSAGLGGSTHFLVAATVGSTSKSTCKAAVKQKVFPWVGTAVQLDTSTTNDGRIFCFLPMPVDAASKLPVHVNGTFGLNDDRRSMKWPGIDRRNDPTANWNDTLVSQLLPPCYAELLINAKDHLTPDKFYKAWPDVSIIKGSHWEKCLNPLFVELFRHAVLWSKRTEALREVGEWVTPLAATLIPMGEKLPSVVHKALSNSGLKLVNVPKRIWDAFRNAQIAVTEVSPRLARNHLRSVAHCYTSVDPIGKRVLLRYCLMDRQYQELNGIALLPLANGNFVPFQQRNRYSSVYLCTSACPRDLLPNLDHMLVDVIDDQAMQSSLVSVANSSLTQLTLLTPNQVAQLLPQSMPASWQRCRVASLSNSNFPSSWFEKFWQWMRGQNHIRLFENQFVLPAGSSSVMKLARNQPVVYVPQFSTYSENLLSAFDKLGVMYVLHDRFPYLQYHQSSLTGYVYRFDTDGILDAIYYASAYSGVSLTSIEAESLLSVLSWRHLRPSPQRNAVLNGLVAFRSGSNSSHILSSLNKAVVSPLKKAVIEPPNCSSIVNCLPSNFLLFSRSDPNQVQLLSSVGAICPTDAGFLLQHIFPLMQWNMIPDSCIDTLMNAVLSVSSILISQDYSIASNLSELAFVRTASGRRQCPNTLYDPSNSVLAEMYNGESVFPIEPYNSPQWLRFMKQTCGLRTSIKPDEILSIISVIKLPSNGYPQSVSQTKLSRAKAVLHYISSTSFGNQASVTCYLHECRGHLSFSSALNYLANHYSWLPLLDEPPISYPSGLPWKGEGFTSHFVTPNGQSHVLTTENSKSLPHIVGSQMYLTDTAFVSPSLLQSSSETLCANVIAHLKTVISHKKKLSEKHLASTVNKIYAFLHKQGHHNIKALASLHQWIYIRKRNTFVRSTVVSIQPNPDFRQDLEPYLNILPESLVQYQTLFTGFGVSQFVTPSQIFSVLGMIKTSVDRNEAPITSSNMWNIVMSILNWLTDNGTKAIQISKSDELYVPTESDSKWPQLKSATDVIYTDNDFLKDFLTSSDSSESYTFVHRRISAQMANSLQLTPLSDFLDITEDTFEDAGQHEPLTVRLKNILREYKDGLTIAKELLQNADDAEASEVNFCYDARTHLVDRKTLFFPEMLQCHGPALLVHNNKTFSKEDFENITKLAGATKQDKPLKIGKFGVGFCSVYHITDIPSFVSRDSLTIFDPTVSYLKKEIRNLSRPGKKVKFTSPFIRQSNQLSPYVGLFGFDKETEFDGTIFRFPFRSAPSELSSTCYTGDHHIQQLISEMKACSSNLMLFLQHVKKITFQVIGEQESTPSIKLKILRCNQSIPCLPANTCIKKITCQAVTSHWIVSHHSTDISGKDATASIAVPLQGKSSSPYATNISLEGEVFCFLPLSQKTGLPVHVSSNFAVINNRRGIWTSDEAASQANEEVQWNEALMRSIIPTAYHRLLEAVQSMQSSNLLRNYVFHSLWPLEESLKVRNPWTTMVRQLYHMISDSKLFYSDITEKWLTMSESKFLAPGILCHSSLSVTEENEDVPKILKHLSIPLVHLPLNYRSHLHLATHTMNENDFLSLFFKHLDGLSAIQHSRDQLILSMLEVYAADYDDGTERSYTIDGYLRHCACIPCAPDGCILRKCSELIDPGSKFAQLYDEEEHRFPLEYLVTRRLASTALFDLGILSDKLSYTDVVERAETITKLFHRDKSKAQQRIKLILKTIQFNMKEIPQSPPKVTLDSIPFLPVMQKPHDYPLTWTGESDQLLCGKDLMLCGDSRKSSDITNAVIAGSQVAILNEYDEGGCESLSIAVQKVLKVRSSPSCDEVILQLSELIQMFNPKTATPELRSWVDGMCRQVYRFLDEKATDEEKKNIQKLTKLPCIWNGEKFLHVQHTARVWKLNGPYLYPVPSIISFRKRLCEALAVKEVFSNEDVENAIKQMKVDFGDQPVDEKCQQLLKELVSHLLKIKPNEFTHFQILLPDEKYTLVSSSDLAYNDAPWAPTDESYRFVNDIIPRSLAIQLHVKAVRTRWLDKYVNPNAKFGGSEFGQKEELTRRIQNILRDYPFDITVLKELLQNADDARANKMCVILDKRSHGSQGVLSEEWQKLQGPALLVWNDSTFSEKDFSGIQELGLGSKRSESDTIGQYGIGFNSVYHLTDCPSFVSDGDTLCVMDPHCRYVPGATPLSPGRRFDNLKSGFWDRFKDMKSAYLRSNVENLPDEFLGGSLFRFPLRNTYDLTRSEIVPERTPITSSKMQDHLDEWAPKMMKAMFFLNNVRELRFYVIERNATVVDIQHHYCIEVSQSAQKKCDHLQGKVSAFKGSEPCVVMYPLTLVDKLDSKEELKQKWFINQGIGDIEKQHQMWSSVSNVKPRHGIAAPTDARSSEFEGQVFCFLPLPISSSLPIHINGHFMLNSTRRQLWRATNPGEEDGLSIWNKNLISAIASSYANFLTNAPQCYVSQHHYSNWKTLLDDIHGYYSVFPLARTDNLDKEWLALAKDCFKKICKANSRILAVVVKQDTTGHDMRLTVTWHQINSEADSLQVYFWSRGGEAKTIEPVLEAIGMKITSAPYRLRHFLNSAIDSEDKKCPEISPSSVYTYYIRFSSQVTSGQQPCDITATSFKSIENFKTFTCYVLRSPSSDGSGLEFPSSPFGHPLLLTADGKLRTFDEKKEVLLSDFVKLFPKSSATFVHPDLLDIRYSKTYFATENSDYSVVHKILFENLPLSLCDAERCQNARTLLPVEKLQQLWICFTSDSVFSSNLATILQRWALIPTTDNQLFSSACQLHPILPPPNDNMNNVEVFQVLKRIEMPVVDMSVIVNPQATGCPDLSKHTDVLACLFHLSKESAFSAVLSRQDIEILVTYLSTINYRQNLVCCQQVKSIPMFEDVNGNFTSISTVQAYVWPTRCMCEVAYSKWIHGYSTVFLKPHGSWRGLSSPAELSIKEIEQEDMYVNFIFPHFFLMSESERYEHLRYIRNNLFDTNKIISESTHVQYSFRQRASSFISALRNLKCIGSDGQSLHTVSDFCDHEKEIFTTFEKHFQFLPAYFTNDPREHLQWMKFFRNLGLKTNIDHDEFLQFCKETANGHVSTVRNASRVLVKSLFSAEEGPGGMAIQDFSIKYLGWLFYAPRSCHH